MEAAQSGITQYDELRAQSFFPPISCPQIDLVIVSVKRFDDELDHFIDRLGILGERVDSHEQKEVAAIIAGLEALRSIHSETGERVELVRQINDGLRENAKEWHGISKDMRDRFQQLKERATSNG